MQYQCQTVEQKLALIVSDTEVEESRYWRVQTVGKDKTRRAGLWWIRVCAGVLSSGCLRDGRQILRCIGPLSSSQFCKQPGLSLSRR